MFSVTQRISVIKQPYGGYINRKEFTITQLENKTPLNNNENINAGLVGLVVDYMTRFMMGSEKRKSFKISLNGAVLLDLFTANKNKSARKNAEKLLENIKGLDKKSIISATKLVGYDVCFRAGIERYKPVNEINPDIETIENMIIMINNTLSFWQKYGPITKDGFTFEGGYTKIISSGDGDYLTKDTLWDLKVSKREPDSKYTLQLLIYYLLGIHSVHKEFKNIKKLGIYNPRMNKVYTINIDSISTKIIDEVLKDVIGY